jgi:DNA-3-methyladenine glycosylase
MGHQAGDTEDMGKQYGRAFFERPPDDVALDLIGSLMRVRDGRGDHVVQVVETEAYGGSDDAASHAFSGPTSRCRVMFGPAGHLYVYRIYGVHWCVNVVTGAEGTASAVLLRAGAWCHRSSPPTGATDAASSLRGPGNLTRTLGITGDDNDVDCCGRSANRVAFYTGVRSDHPFDVSVSARVGVTRDIARPWRYFASGHRDVSRFVAGRLRR